ncbi:MAG TPA: hypothetical protein VF584_08965 [Longimicrobium sp.]|jgi:hypothetical protein
MASSFARPPLFGALFLVAACTPSKTIEPLALYPASAESHQARLLGKLSMEGSCLYIIGEGGERWLAAFPSPGSRWDAGENGVWVGARLLRVSERGAFVGGEVSNSRGTLQWVQAPAASCDDAKLWIVSALTDL